LNILDLERFANFGVGLSTNVFSRASERYPILRGFSMIVRIRSLLLAIGEAFWLVPGALVVSGILAAVGLTELDRSGAVPKALSRQRLAV
jgi:hypothetical protein